MIPMPSDGYRAGRPGDASRDNSPELAGKLLAAPGGVTVPSHRAA